jgi:hypothetical protein
VASLAVATGAWLFGPARWPERVLLGVGSLPMLVMEPLYIGIGAAIIAVGVLVHILGLRRHRADEPRETRVRTTSPETGAEPS